MTVSDVKILFKHIPIDPEANAKYERVRKSAEELAVAILEVTPPGGSQTDAINCVRHALWSAQDTISRAGK
jgi:hypothetical protein